MTKKLHQWTQEEIQDMGAKAGGLFMTLNGLTATPREAAEIIMMMHLMLWLNYGDGSSTVDDMLNDYADGFKKNYEVQVAAAKQGAN